MKRDTSDQCQEQELFLDSAEALRGHLRSQVRQALHQVFAEEIRGLCGEHYHPTSNEHYRAGSAPSYVMVEGHREPMSRPELEVSSRYGRVGSCDDACDPLRREHAQSSCTTPERSFRGKPQFTIETVAAQEYRTGPADAAKRPFRHGAGYHDARWCGPF